MRNQWRPLTGGAIAVLFLTLNLSLAAQAQKPFSLPNDIAYFFRSEGLTDDGGLTGEESQRKAFRRYVAENWKFLLQHASELPRNQGQFGNTVGLIGAAAAYELHGVEYLAFVGEAIDLAEKGKIPRKNVFDLISGENTKNGFMAFNYRDPRVQELVKRAQALVPKEDEVTASWLKDVASGEAAKPENFYNIDPNGVIEKLPVEQPAGAATRAQPTGSEGANGGTTSAADSRSPSLSTRLKAEPTAGGVLETKGAEWMAGGVVLILAVIGVAIWKFPRRAK